MAKNAKHETLARQVIELVGGAENISMVTHCVTRLRFILKDQSIAKKEEIKKLEGVMGCQISGGQFQVIIGPAVNRVYDEVCLQAGVSDEMHGVDDSVPAQKGKKTVKSVFGSIITNLTSCVLPVLPIFVCSGMLKMLLTIFGPGMLNVMGANDGVFTVLSFASDAGFYFLPIAIGYTSAKQFRANPFIGMFMGMILVSPAFVELVNKQASLDIFGIPVTGVSYASSVVPIILITFIMSYVERFFTRYIPDMLQLMLVPLCTVIVMLPLALCALGPLGFILGTYLSTFFLGIHDVLGPIGIGVIAALFQPLVLTGMHHALNMTSIANMMSVGYDSVVFIAAAAAGFSVIGTVLAFALKAKKKKNKSIGFSSFISQTLGGVVEPSLYGIMLPFKRPFAAQAIGAFVGAVYLGITNVHMFTLTGSNVLIMLGFVGGSTTNLINAIIGCTIAAVVGFVVMWIIGFNEEEA